MSKDNLLRIGQVTLIRGRHIEVKVDQAKNASYLLYDGEQIKGVGVGSYVKITKGYENLVGRIEGEFIKEENNSTNYKTNNSNIHRSLEVKLVGYFEKGKFKQGIKELPLVFNECYLANPDEFSLIHDFTSTDKPSEEKTLTIGQLSNQTSQEIKLGINKLFAGHIGIFGNTGSGKSYTLASLYYKLLLQFNESKNFKKNSKFLLIDFNGEYTNGSAEDSIITNHTNKDVYNLSSRSTDGDKYPIPKTEIDEEFWSVYLTATDKTQKPFLKRALNNKWLLDHIDTAEGLKKLLSSSLTKLIENKKDKGTIIELLNELKHAFIDEAYNSLANTYHNKLEFHSGVDKYRFNTSIGEWIYADAASFYSTAVNELVENLNLDISSYTHFQKTRAIIILQYYHEIANYNLNPEFIAPLIKRLKKTEDLDKVIIVKDELPTENFEIISLKNLNTTLKKVIPLLICRNAYEKKKHDKEEGKHLNLIIDEAHNILSYASERESESWKDYRMEVFEEIIKEGRKFGVFMTIASQRPFDISPTIISQLHNYFLHRLINDKDIQAIERTVSYLDKVSFESLPLLPTGSCVVAGLCARIPVIVDIDSIEAKFEPNNKTIKPTDHWS